MASLQKIAPNLACELVSALSEKLRPELVEQLSHQEVDRCSEGDDDGLGYIHLIRSLPGLHFRNLSTPVAETISFYDTRGLNVDVDHDGQVFGIEFIGRPDVTAELRASNAL